MSTLEEFRAAVKYHVETRGGYKKPFPADLGLELDFLVKDPYKADFYKYTYTPEIDKEVEAVWQRKRSKLAKALR